MPPILDQTFSVFGDMCGQSRETGHVAVVLNQIKNLPTLPAVVSRLLALTADDSSTADEVVSLIRSDPALTTRVISMARVAGGRVCGEGLTVERAVIRLGFKAVRNAVLSLKVLESLNRPSAGAGCFDAREFWRHCLAVATTAELIAAECPDVSDLNPQEAFVAGLLHDIGKLALSEVLPKSYGRVVSLAESSQEDISRFEQHVLGINHHVAGRKLAEHWQLPLALQDCIQLHGVTFGRLPDLVHRRLVALVGLADMVVRRQHIGFSGNCIMDAEPEEVAVEMGLNPESVGNVLIDLHEEVCNRAEMFGLDTAPRGQMVLRSIAGANAVLGRLNSALQLRGAALGEQVGIIRALRSFQDSSPVGKNIPDVVNDVATSFASYHPGADFALLVPLQGSSEPSRWLLTRYDAEGIRAKCDVMTTTKPALAPVSIDRQHDRADLSPEFLEWAEAQLDWPDTTAPRIAVPLNCGWAMSGVLLYEDRGPARSDAWHVLWQTWGMAIAAAAQHDGNRQLSDQLAEVNRAMAEAQQRLAQHESMVRLGALAASTAREMDNPQTVISSQSQRLLKMVHDEPSQRRVAEAIVEASERLVGLTTLLHEFSDPPRPQPVPTDVALLLGEVVRSVGADLEAEGFSVPITLQAATLPRVCLDPEQIRQAVRELLLNAAQAGGACTVHLSARSDGLGGPLIIEIQDDGEGMPQQVLKHAMDPFFSGKISGRHIGMGLARARRVIESHGGKLELNTAMGNGTLAVVTLAAA